MAALDLFAYLFVFCTPVLHTPTGIEVTSAGAVVRSGKEIHSQVHTNNVTDVLIPKLGNILGDRNVEKPLSKLIDKLGGPEFSGAIKVLLHGLARKRNLDSPVQRINGEPVLIQRIVPVPNKITLGRSEISAYPFTLIFENGPVAGDNSLYYRLCHLRTKPEVFPQITIKNIVQDPLPQAPGFENMPGDKVAGVGIRGHCASQDILLFRGRKNLKLRCNCNHIITTIHYKQIIPHTSEKHNRGEAKTHSSHD